MLKIVERIIERTTIWTLLATISLLIVLFGAVTSNGDATGTGIAVLVLVGFGRYIKSGL